MEKNNTEILPHDMRVLDFLLFLFTFTRWLDEEFLTYSVGHLSISLIVSISLDFSS